MATSLNDLLELLEAQSEQSLPPSRDGFGDAPPEPRWRTLAELTDPRLTRDPGWPALSTRPTGYATPPGTPPTNPLLPAGQPAGPATTRPTPQTQQPRQGRDHGIDR